MKKTIALIGLLIGTGALGAQAATPAHALTPESRTKTSVSIVSGKTDLKATP